MAIDLTGYKLVFDDEFNSFNGGPNRTDQRWQTTFFWGARSGVNGEQQTYCDSTLPPNPFALVPGGLTITSRPASGLFAGTTYSSGIIQTAWTHAQQYGYFECRCKMPQGIGMLPAFWLYQNGGHGEIDIVEAFGATKPSTGEGGSTQIHWATHDDINNTGDWIAAPGSNINIYTQYHLYGCLWTASTVNFYFDNVLYASTPTDANLKTPLYITANVAVGGVWPPAPAGETTVMTIDYIRAYSNDPTWAAVRLDTVTSPDGGGTADLHNAQAGDPAGTESIWGTAVPTSKGADTLQYELGTIFQPLVNGQVTGIRVFGTAGETGTHTARIWDNTLNSVIAGPYAFQFQQDAWHTWTIPAVNLTAGRQYTVTVTTGTDANFFYPASTNALTSPGTNGKSLSYPANAGVFTQTMGSRPTSVSSSSNYFRDVIFTPSSPPPPPPKPIPPPKPRRYRVTRKKAWF